MKSINKKPRFIQNAGRTTLVLQISLLLTAMTTVHASDEGRAYTWDHVRLYAHLGIGDGLEPEQYSFLADHYDLITFTGGIIKDKDNVAVEPKIEYAARTIKERNPKAKVLFYWACDQRKHQWEISNASFPENGYLEGGKRFNLDMQDVRDWWSDIAGQAVHKYSCDGIFVDGATSPRVKKERLFSMVQDAKKKMGPDKIIIFNALHGHDKNTPQMGEEYLLVTDGAMIDNFDRGSNVTLQSAEYMANTIKAMRKAGKDGKIVVFKAWPGFTWWSAEEMMKRYRKTPEKIYDIAKERITFPLACFLVGAEPNCYFCYTWGWLGEHGTFYRYPEFDKPLGDPKGDAIQEGWTFQREFEHASVFVDLEIKYAKIDWK